MYVHKKIFLSRLVDCGDLIIPKGMIFLFFYAQKKGCPQKARLLGHPLDVFETSFVSDLY
jgi:hypothetical protein